MDEEKTPQVPTPPAPPTPPEPGPAPQSPTPTLINQEPPTPEGEKPEWLSDDLWDAEKKTYKVEALADQYRETSKRAEGLRKKLSEGGHKPPEKPEDYKMPELDKAIADSIPADDAMLGKFRGIAKEAGVSQAQFETLMKGFFGMVPEVVQPKEMTEEQVQEYRRTEIAKLGDGGHKVVAAVTLWQEQLMAQGQFGDADKKAFAEVCSTAEGVAMMNKLRVMVGGSDIPTNVSIADGLPSDKEIAYQYDQALKSGDPSKIAEAEKLFDRRLAAGRPINLAF